MDFTSNENANELGATFSELPFLLNYPFTEMNGATALILAVRNGLEEKVRFLLCEGADIAISDDVIA